MLVEPCHWLTLCWWSHAIGCLCLHPQDFCLYNPLYCTVPVVVCHPATAARLSGLHWSYLVLPGSSNRQIRTILLGTHFGLSHWYLPSSGWSLYSPLLLPTLIPLGYQVLDIYNGKVLINHNILISCKVG